MVYYSSPHTSISTNQHYYPPSFPWLSLPLTRILPLWLSPDLLLLITSTWSEMLRRLFGSSGSNSPPPSPPGEKAVKMMMITGKCQFRGQTGRFKCTCQAGSSFQSTSAVDLDVLCRECNHPMAEHGGYATGTSIPSFFCAFTRDYHNTD